jgi:hypothetical protein
MTWIFLPGVKNGGQKGAESDDFPLRCEHRVVIKTHFLQIACGLQHQTHSSFPALFPPLIHDEPNDDQGSNVAKNQFFGVTFERVPEL